MARSYKPQYEKELLESKEQEMMYKEIGNTL